MTKPRILRRPGKRILVVDTVLEFGLSVAQRLQRDGCDVCYSSIWGPEGASPYCDFLGRGCSLRLAPEAWMAQIEWAQLATVTGSEHRGALVEYLRAQRVPTVGPDSRGAALELDRDLGHKVAAAAGLRVPWQQRFASVAAIRDHVKASRGLYVLKLDQTLRAACETFVSSDPSAEDLLSVLDRLESRLGFAAGSVGLYLQERVAGLEVSVGGWFNGREIVDGRLLVNYESAPGFLYDLRVSGHSLIDARQLTAALAAQDYRGPFDINGMVGADGRLTYLEWTPRWGAGMTEFMCHATENLAALLEASATGGQARLLRKDLAPLTLVVNARVDDPDEICDVILPRGGAMPVAEADRSFWADNAGFARAWHVFPLQRGEHRRARYVADAATVDDAAIKIEELAGRARLVDSYVDTAAAVAVLRDRADELADYFKDAA